MAVSGFPVIVQYDDTIIILVLILTILILIFRRTNIEKSFLIFLSVFIILTSIQLITFNVFPLDTMLGFFSKIIVAYLIIKVVNRSFINTYVNLMYFISIISFLFWLPSFVSVGLKVLIVKSAPFWIEGFDFHSYIIYQPFIGDINEWTRNSGPFWEAGAFAGFLIIALILNYIRSYQFSDRKTFVITIGVLSTFSTTGYIALFLFFVFVLLIKYRNLLSTILAIFVIIPAIILAYQKIPFLSEKISSQIESSDTKIALTVHRSRFSSAIIDLQDFKEHPLAGRGKYSETRFNIWVKAINRNNGTTDLLVMYGLVGFLTYFMYYFISFRNIMKYYNRRNKLFSYYYILIILILGFSENYFLLPFFWSLCFIGFTIKGQVISQSPNELSGTKALIIKHSQTSF